MLVLNEVLVPVDFSEASSMAVEKAFTFVNGESPVVIIHHVVDPALAGVPGELGLSDEQTVIKRLRERSTVEIEALAGKAPEGVRVEPVVSVGVPFFEIIRKAEEFDVDAVIMPRAGMPRFGERQRAEAFLFGSTAERVVRGSKRQVIILPA